MKILLVVALVCGVCQPDALKCMACKTCVGCKACAVDGKTCSVKRAAAKESAVRGVFRWLFK